jgi:hypothetical protein
VKKQNGWIELLRDGKGMLRDLLDASERRYEELNQPKPPAFFLYPIRRSSGALNRPASR